jgi:hypothetical protein
VYIAETAQQRCAHVVSLMAQRSTYHLSKRVRMAVAALAIVATAVLALGRGSAEPTAARAARFVPGLTPISTERHGISSYADYSADPKAQLPSPHAKRHVRKVTAHVAVAEQAAAFSVLAKPQTTTEAGDSILRLVAANRPEVDVARAQALDSARRYWLLPTDDGQVCLGQKTTGVRVFAMVCGYDETVAKTGLAQRLGDDLVALVPDGARAARTDAGDALSVSDNLLVAGAAHGASFELDGKTRRVTG